jgi:hypothetical protein
LNLKIQFIQVQDSLKRNLTDDCIHVLGSKVANTAAFCGWISNDAWLHSLSINSKWTVEADLVFTTRGLSLARFDSKVCES